MHFIIPDMNKTGYLHPLYSHSLSEFGEPVELPDSKGWVLKRSIPGTSQFDAIGCYPIFTCENWSNLEKDLDSISSQLVSLSLVTDPFGQYTQQNLQRSFKDIAKPYKEHFIVDLKQKPVDFVSAHHQRNARKAMEMVDIEIYSNPYCLLDEWVSLYQNLIERHSIKGIAKFSREAFAKQFRIPGIIVFRALVNDKTAGMLVWYVQGDIGYYHLGAYSSEGYKSKASFALFWTLLGFFADSGLRWLSLGAGAGLHGDNNDGLTRFKHGWATGTRLAFFCGRIFNPKLYQELVSEHPIKNIDYFPTYRAGEFA